MQDERIKRDLRHPLIVDLPPHRGAHPRDHTRPYELPELALRGKPGVAVDHQVDVGGGVLKTAEERARAPERALREVEVGEETAHPGVPGRHLPDLLLRLVDPGDVAVRHPVDRVEIRRLMLPDPRERFGKIVFAVPAAGEARPLPARVGDVAEDAPHPVGVVVVRDRVEAALAVLDEVTKTYRRHACRLSRKASTASHSAPFRRIRRAGRSTTVLGVPGSSPPSTR